MLAAGTDVECQSFVGAHATSALNQSLITEARDRIASAPRQRAAAQYLYGCVCARARALSVRVRSHRRRARVALAIAVAV